MRIAFAQRKILGKNGASRIILEQMQRFISGGHDVWLYCDRCSVELPHGLKVKRYFSLSFSKEKRRDGFANGFKKFCVDNNIDISIGNGDTLHQDILFMHNIVELQHTDGSHKDTRIFRLHDRIMTEQNFRLLVCNSELMRNFFINRYSIPYEKTESAYPGFDQKLFNTADRDRLRAEIREKHGIEREFVLGFVSSGDLALRGVQTLIEAVGLIPQNLAERCAVVLIGKDDKIEQYRQKIVTASPHIAAYALGAVDNIHKYFSSMDIMLHPSRIETFGMTILEARASGVPVVTSKMCGVHEIFSEAEKQVLMDKPDSGKLAEYTVRLLTDKDFYNDVSLAASEKAKSYTWDAYFSRLSAFYSAFGISF